MKTRVATATVRSFTRMSADVGAHVVCDIECEDDFRIRGRLTLELPWTEPESKWQTFEPYESIPGSPLRVVGTRFRIILDLPDD
jgi:hypothetical protein